jgi:hypothetical protein
MYRFVKNVNGDISLYLKKLNIFEPYATINKNSQLSFVVSPNNTKIGLKLTSNTSVFGFLLYEFDSYQILPAAPIEFTGNIYDLFDILHTQFLASSDFDINVEPPVVNVEAPVVNVEAPIVNIEAPLLGSVENFDVDRIYINRSFDYDLQTVQDFKSIKTSIRVTDVRGDTPTLTIILQTFAVDDFVDVYSLHPIQQDGLYTIPEIQLNSSYRWRFVVSGESPEFLVTIVTNRNTNFGSNFASFFDKTDGVLSTKRDAVTATYDFEYYKYVSINIKSISGKTPANCMPQFSFDGLNWLNALPDQISINTEGLIHINIQHYGKYVRLLITENGDAQRLEYVQFYSKL